MSHGELDIIILQVRAIQGFFTDNRGEESMNLDKAAALYNPVAQQLVGRFGYHTTEAPIQDFQERNHCRGASRVHTRGKTTLVIDLSHLMFSEECGANVYQAHLPDEDYNPMVLHCRLL
eukprot:5615545-Amphidinium_carterae.1